MVAGHFGLAAAVKAKEPQVPLWSLMLATAWLDVLFVPLYIAGIERIEPAPGTGGTGYGEGVIYADYTHSLVGALALGLLFGLIAAVPWGRRTGAVLGAVVFSHWVLDLLVHRGDMPILPGNLGDLPRLGFGLWQIPLAAAAAELALVAIGAVLYGRAAARRAGPAAGGRSRLAAGATFAVGVLVLGLSVLGL
ncbi:MAG: permease [Chloroflexi bacterium 13_1_40CM_2_70_6]|nr:MAG: permease [Chloroflexi bacterium 13_1_40CM_4_69_19]OLD51657.1 MAG: permease [Chloroflexi bacterium 13_1_40CM_2_70_6]